MSAMQWICACGAAAAFLMTGAWLDGPSDTEAEAATAAQVSDARIDEWVQAAARANPGITAAQLQQVRDAARAIEGTRR